MTTPLSSAGLAAIEERYLSPMPLTSLGASSSDDVPRLCETIRAKDARIAELEANASRYEWLRSDGLDFIKLAELTCDTCDVGLDHAIDVRLAAVPPKGE